MDAKNESYEALRQAPDAPESAPAPETLRELDADIDAEIRSMQEAQLREAVHAFGAYEAKRTSEDELDAVRSRLKMPSRRDVLRGAAATAAVAVTGMPLESSRARAEEAPFVLSPEQERAYREGLEKMRMSAATDTREIDRFFVAWPDGSDEWFDGGEHTMATFDTPEGAGFLQTVDPAADEKASTALADGAFLNRLHTHPTAAFKEMEIPQAEKESVPPSPTDIVNAVQTVARLSPGEAARTRFTAVAERGAWNFTPDSLESAKRLLRAFQAGTPSLELLKRHHDGPAVAEYLRAYLKKNEAEVPAAVADAYDQRIIPAIADGTMVDGLLGGGSLVVEDMAELGKVLEADAGTPTRVRRYFRLIERARDEIVHSLDAIAPNTDEYILVNPDPSDAFREYVAQWHARGIDMTFTPFESEDAPAPAQREIQKPDE